MTAFWIVAGLLIAGALLFVLPPLLGRRPISGGSSHGQVNLNIYRDQLQELDRDLELGGMAREQYDAARNEIERRVLEESREAGDTPAPAQAQWTLVSAVGVLLPVLAIGLYLLLGNPAALTARDGAAGGDDSAHSVTPEQIEAMVRKLAERLKTNPEDGQGWLMLAKSYGAMGRFGDASEAYAQAQKRLPPDAQLLADYADALAMAQGRSLAGEPERLVTEALKVDPENVKALALAGTVAYGKNDYKGAIGYWQRILPLLPPESDLAQRLQGSIADAEAKLGGGSAPAKLAKAAPATDAAVSGRITLSPEAAKAVQAGDTVFIFARAAQGPRMPLAIFRTQAGSLPTEFRLDDSMGLSAERKLSQAGEVLVGARVSRSGSATPGQGDWESALVPVKPGASGVQLAIDRPYKG